VQELQEYAKFLRANLLEDYVRESLRRVRKLDIPLMKLFAGMTNEQMFEMSMQTTPLFLQSLEEGNALAVMKASLDNWEQDKLGYGISQEQITPDDLVLTYAVQKQTLIYFIPRFTQDVETAIAIVLEIMELYMQTQKLAFDLLFRIRDKIASQLRHSNEELLKLNEDLEQFTYLASHDLKEPLRMVSNYTQLLQHDYGDKLDENGREYIRFAVEGVLRMRDMINYLLNYAKVSKGEIRFAEVDMMQVMHDVQANLKQQIKEKNAELVYENLPRVSGDKVQMMQLMQNLVSNAIKFTDKKPRVDISAAKQENGTVQFAVKDNGIGIPEAYTKKIFVLFQRLHDREKFLGSGIGLAICKRIVERHGGTIWFESDTKKGTSFYFTLQEA
jgi:signal transduction histidine kinase